MEKHTACQHFLADTEMENGIHKVLSFTMSKLDTTIVNETIEEVFNKLDIAAKINVALGFVLPNNDTVNGEYQFFYAIENNILF